MMYNEWIDRVSETTSYVDTNVFLTNSSTDSQAGIIEELQELHYLYLFVSFTEDYTYDLSTLVHLRCESFLLRYTEIFLEIVNSIPRYNPRKYLNSVFSSRIRNTIVPCNFHEIFVE